MLDGCDLDECYKTMMAERTDLIKARREAEDNLVKTVVQLSATLIALIAGFITQTSVVISYKFLPLLMLALILLLVALSSGLSEHVFSSKAYLAQQQAVEKFYTRQINEFSEPAANKWVKRCQITSFSTFIIALLALGSFSVLQVGEKSRDQHTTCPTTSSSAATAAASTVAASLDVSRQLRRQGNRQGRAIGRTEHAAASTEER